MILKNGRVLTERAIFEETDVVVEDGKIVSVGKTAAPGEDVSGAYVVPGLIDLHTHGVYGFDHLDGDPEATAKMRRFYAAQGTTGILATVMTAPGETMRRAVENAMKTRPGDGATIFGIYLEGPFFSSLRNGAQLPDALRLPDPVFLDELISASGRSVKIVSLAPELPGALDLIRTRKDVSFFLGHTAADYETARQAIDAGAKGVTHTFNQMEPFHHRAPGLIGAAVESSVFCECITDGLHVHPSAVRLLFQAIGRERFVSITDSLRPTGLPDGEYVSGGQKVDVKDGLARLKSGVIAGSTLTMLQGVRNLIRFGLRIEDAFYVSTATPAKAAGVFDEVGSITVGKRADLLVLDRELALKTVVIGGEKQ